MFLELNEYFSNNSVICSCNIHRLIYAVEADTFEEL